MCVQYISTTEILDKADDVLMMTMMMPTDPTDKSHAVRGTNTNVSLGLAAMKPMKKALRLSCDCLSHA